MSIGLTLNQDKCQVMVIRTMARIRDIFWKEEEKMKLLGVCLDSRCQFTEHVNYLVKICSYKISFHLYSVFRAQRLKSDWSACMRSYLQIQSLLDISLFLLLGQSYCPELLFFVRETLSLDELLEDRIQESIKEKENWKEKKLFWILNTK